MQNDNAGILRHIPSDCANVSRMKIHRFADGGNVPRNFEILQWKYKKEKFYQHICLAYSVVS